MPSHSAGGILPLGFAVVPSPHKTGGGGGKVGGGPGTSRGRSRSQRRRTKGGRLWARYHCSRNKRGRRCHKRGGRWSRYRHARCWRTRVSMNRWRRRNRRRRNSSKSFWDASSRFGQRLWAISFRGSRRCSSCRWSTPWSRSHRVRIQRLLGQSRTCKSPEHKLRGCTSLPVPKVNERN